jgi:hypothetical protein
MRYLIPFAFLALALAAYIASLAPGVLGALVIVGMFFEALFWRRIWPAKKQVPVRRHS